MAKIFAKRRIMKLYVFSHTTRDGATRPVYVHAASKAEAWEQIRSKYGTMTFLPDNEIKYVTWRPMIQKKQ